MMKYKSAVEVAHLRERQTAGRHDDRLTTAGAGATTMSMRLAHRVNRTLMGGDVARTRSPFGARAGAKRVCSAHVDAAAPNPCPGSATIATDSAPPSDRTTTRMTTICSSICSASASAGHGQDQL
jgi:hypothetical protein